MDQTPLTRIGPGVPTQPKTPQRRKWFGIRPEFVIAAAVIISMSLAITTGYVFSRPTGNPGAVASPPPASPSRASFGEHRTCVLLVPTLQDGAAAVKAIVEKPDGSTVDWPKLRAAIKDLNTIRDVAPDDMVGDIQAQLQPLAYLLAVGEGRTTNGRMQLEEYREAGLRLASRCAKYAS